MILRILQYLFGGRHRIETESINAEDFTLQEGLFYDDDGELLGTSGIIDTKERKITQIMKIPAEYDNSLLTLF